MNRDITLKVLSLGIAIILAFAVAIPMALGAGNYIDSIDLKDVHKDTGVATADSPIYLPFVMKLCAPLYADDFSDPASGWPVYDYGYILEEYLAGEYRILIRDADYFDVVLTDFKFSDFVLAVDVRNVTGNDGSYGLTFGFTDDWSEGYSFEIEPNGYYWIFKLSDSDWEILAEGVSADINGGTATNQIMAKRDGAEISVYANGQLITSINDNSYLGERYVGLTAWPYDQPNLDVRFDNFVVYPLACDVAASGISPGSLNGAKVSKLDIMDKKVGRPNGRSK